MNFQPRTTAAELSLDADESWYKSAIIYQLHVKAFADSNHDGIGDFAGLSDKLDYLQDLGVTALWLCRSIPRPAATTATTSPTTAASIPNSAP
jgi:maltose alpha-D-glucosyltransferase/alpha-amylase